MVERLKTEGYAHIDDGALVVDVEEETDTKDVPPCIIQKSDGASLYSTTDLATLVQREEDYHPDQVIYLADNARSCILSRCSGRQKRQDRTRRDGS